MEINAPALQSLYTSFNTSFQGGFAGVESLHNRVATTVPSSSRENEYGWLKGLKGFREWVGDRQINSISADGYKIRNVPYEHTIGVDRDDIKDDQLGIYSPLFQDMGETAATFPDTLVWNLLKNGFATECFDKQFFFDTDHPVIGEDGVMTTVSNTGGGAGSPWFLLDVTRSLKPLIFQLRAPFDNLIRQDDDNAPNVFNRKEYVYGVDGRCSVGFGFWQMAYGSKQALTGAAYGTARAAMGSFKGDYGRPLGIRPTLLVVGPGGESAGRKILNSENASGGETNEWKGTAELLVVPWLA